MKKYLIAGGILTAIIALICFLFARNKSLRADLAEANRNVNTLITEQTNYKINDSLNVSKIKALELSKDQAEKYVKGLKEEISQLKGSKKEKVISYTTITKYDTISLPITDTVIVKGDTCFGYNDQYMSFLYCGDSAYIEQNDTIKQVISKAYKHKFLWWRFGNDGINQHVWSTNPRSHIVFDKFVEFE